MRNQPLNKLKIKLMAFDLDGTLLNDNGEVSAFTQTVLAQAQAQGIHLSLATGRLFARLPDSVLQLKAMDYAVLCNGASVEKWGTREKILQHSLSMQSSHSCWEIIRKHPIYAEFYAHGEAHTDESRQQYFSENFYPPSKRTAMARSHIMVEDLGQFCLSNPIDKIFMPFVPDSILPLLQEEIANIPGTLWSMSSRNCLEINAAGCAKDVALLQLALALQIQPDEVVVFGDAHNDASMLAAFKHSVAMGQAAQDIKNIARYTTNSNQKEGVANFIKKHILN